MVFLHRKNGQALSLFYYFRLFARTGPFSQSIFLLFLSDKGYYDSAV
jgi:hypothetical protein